MKKVCKLGLVLLVSAFFASTLSAKQCFNAKDIDVKWTGFKTLKKIGVRGNFSDVKLKIKNKNSSKVESLLKDSKVTINLENIDGGYELINNNFQQYFVKHLSTKTIKAKILNAKDGSMNVKITLNGVSKNIPMSYKTTSSNVVAMGVIDAMDFKIVKALKILNKHVSGHKNKGWYDIPLEFDMKLSKKCM